jgi:predicted transcriptional regulator
MARPRSETLTVREAQIMSILWEKQAATAVDVRRALPGDLHGSTVRTLLRVLERKGCVKHVTEGKSYVYRAVMPRKKAERTAVGSLLRRFFGGSAEALVQRLIEDERLTREQLADLQKLARKGTKRRRRTAGS